MITIEAETVIIVGSGLAALTAADRLSIDKNVIILTKSKINNNNSSKAQGGVAASIAKTDHWQIHLKDTMIAGCNFNDKNAVELLVKEGPSHIKRLIDQGLAFDHNDEGELLLGKEGAHSGRRILHAGGDATGKVIMDFMISRLNENVTIIEDETVLDLIIEKNRCVGLITSNKCEMLSVYYANHIIIATGGCGGLYQVTSNDPTILGDGIALAYRGGAELTDLEFVQFHPTMLYINNHCYGLVSEAVRGEGAVLVSNNGQSIMKGIHPLEDLAPRDVVARAINNVMNQGSIVFLDVSMINDFKSKFPTITSLCEQANINLENGLIPVAPGSHFLMGGIKTNHVGATTVDGLYAIGEVACTGVHGANRLASNSLLEGIVFSNLLANHILEQPQLSARSGKLSLQPQVCSNNLQLPSIAELRAMMTRYVGIERTKKGLIDAKDWLESYQWQNYHQIDINQCTKEQAQQINAITTCWLIVTSALQRTESRGGHYRKDYPITNDATWGKKHIIRHKREQSVHNQNVLGVGK